MKKWLSILLTIILITVIIVVAHIELKRMGKHYLISFDEADKLIKLEHINLFIKQVGSSSVVPEGLHKQPVYYHPSALLGINIEKVKNLKGTFKLSALSGIYSLMSIYKGVTSLPTDFVNPTFELYSDKPVIAIETPNHLVLKIQS